MKKLSGLFIITMLTLSLAALFNGCGGGSSPSTSRGGGTDATLTASNAPQVADVVRQAVKLVAPATLGQVNATSVSPEKRAPLMSIFEKVAPVIGKHATNGKQSSDILPSEHCSGGGSIEVTNISVPDLSGNVKADVNVNGCTIGTETMNGVLKVTVPVGALTDILHTEKFTIEVTSFTYSDSTTTSLSLTDNFTILARDFTYDGDSLTGGSLTLGGTVSGTIDGSPVNISCDSLGSQFSVNSSGVTVSVSGRMSTSCLGGWVTLSTNIPVFVPADANCPTGGEIVVSAGGSSVTMHVEANSKIDIFFNGALVQKYDDCSQVIGLCTG